MARNHRAARAAAVTVLLALLAGCGGLPQMRWPWGARLAPAPQLVGELVVSAPDAAAPPALTQQWLRNALVIDMQAAGGTGRAYLAPKPRAPWPPRVAFRVRPGSFGMLEVRGDQRVVLPIASEGSQPIDLELVPGVYSPTTARLEIDWGPLAPPAADHSPGA